MSAWKKPSRIAWRRKRLDDRIGESRRDRSRVASSAVEIGRGSAVDPFGGEHPARGAAASRLRERGNPHRPSTLARHLGDRRGFHAQIHLELDRLRERRHRIDRAAGAAPARASARSGGRRRRKLSRSRVELLLDAGPQDLHRHIAARRACAPDAPGRSKLRRPAGRIRRTASRPSRTEIGRDRAAPALRPARRRQPVLQLRQFRRPLPCRRCRAGSPGTARA